MRQRVQFWARFECPCGYKADGDSDVVERLGLHHNDWCPIVRGAIALAEQPSGSGTT